MGARRLSEQDRRDAESEDALRRKATIPAAPPEYLRFVRPVAEDGAEQAAAGTAAETAVALPHGPRCRHGC